METWKRILFPVASLFVLFMFDGVVATFFNDLLYTDIGYMVPRFTIILMIVFCFYLSPNHMFLLATLFGYFYDSYYTGYLGPYIAAFWLVMYVVFQFRNILKPGILTYALVGVLMFAFFELVIFGVYSTIGLTQVSFSTFFTNRFGATVLFNTMILVIFSPILGKFANFITGSDDNFEGI